MSFLRRKVDVAHQLRQIRKACDRKTKRVVIGGRNDTQVVPYDMDDKSLQFVELLTEVDKH